MPGTAPTDVMLHAIDLHAQAGEGGLPEWIQVCPPGPLVEGRDGRAFSVNDPQAAIDASEWPEQLDVDHQSLMWFGSTEAFGWIDRVEYLEEAKDGRGPGFWGHIECLTPEGEDHIRTRRFRFLSPVVRVRWSEEADEAQNKSDPQPPELIGFVNFALTNRPNLTMAELNREIELNRAEGLRRGQERRSTTEQNSQAYTAPESVDMTPKLLLLASQLGLGSGATEEDLANAISEKMVPRTDLEAMQTRAEAAERTIDEDRTKRLHSEADALVERAIREGKIPPASKAFYREGIHDRASLERLSTHVDAMPVIVSGDAHRFTPNTDADGSTEVSLNDEEKRVADEMGVPHEFALKAKKEGL